MKRRDLLKNMGFLTTSVAVFGLPGCGGSSNDPAPAPAPSGDPLSRPGTTGSHKFPQGVMSADPKPDSIILWTRVVMAAADDVAQVGSGEANIAVTLEISASTDFTTLLIPAIALSAQAAHDNSLRHKLTGLNPATTYFYRFKAGTGVSRIGRFKTAPAAAASPAELNFAFVSCQDWSVNHWVGLNALMQQDIDFLVHLGDYIYEAAGDSYQSESPESSHTKLMLPSQTLKPGSTTAHVATTLEDYRYLYKRYRTDSRLQELHARCAIIAIWDDHEFSDDCWQNNETYDNGSVTLVNGVLPVSNEQLGAPSTSAATDTRQTTRRRAANRAWFEFMPADVPDLDESVASNFATVKIYRDLQFGTLAHFVMTDERLYRADHVLPEATPNPASGQPLGSIGARYFVPEPTFLQVQGGKMMAALQAGADAANAAGNTPVENYLKGILGKLQMDPSGSTLTAAEAGTLYDDGLALVSVMGKTQRDWWKTKMATSPSTWKFWGNEVSLLRMALNLNALPAIVAQANALAAAGSSTLKNLLNTYLVNADQWDGYAAERTALTGFLKGAGVKNVVAITGDIHAFYAGEVPANYGAYTEGDSALVDLVTAGISSSSFWSYLAGVVGSFEDEVKAVLEARKADPLGYVNTLETSTNPFRALRPLVYSSGNMLLYQGVRTEVVKQLTTLLPTGSLDVGTPAGQIAFATLSPKQQNDINRFAFEEYLKRATAAGYTPVNTLNETLAGNMGQTLQAMAAAAGLTIPNPYTGGAGAPPVQNPWIKYVQTSTQGFATVKVTPTQVVTKFHHTMPMVVSGGTRTPPKTEEVVTLVKTVTVNKDSTALTVS
ncbi:alkaline phosphatase D [Fluviicoccus keumensis]|uniref:Alkaline phosphatase D n=1 Tax=Fluviicoccus keumensis TaxID=1435465 RepID=A0A4Q7YNH2_9GAMM|nr:alkaline phosphatase D family protein [Fluviicoccus keumensis]RZU38413.1 alkaline phosphatase D [Fluviicoccus keumensis]